MTIEKAKERTNNDKRKSNLGFVIDAYLGRLPVLQIGDAGEGELCYRVFKNDICADWRDESEVISVHLTNDGEKEHAAVDIFRFNDDGKIVEYLDVLQPIPETAATSNTMF